MSKLIDTLVLIVVAVGVSAALWVGANLLFDQARHRWTRFNVLVGFLLGFLGLLILQGNRLLRSNGPDADAITAFGELIWTPLIGGVVSGAVGFVLAGARDPRRRLLTGLVGGSALGAVIGLRLAPEAQPSIEIGWLLGWTAIAAAAGAGIGLLRSRHWRNGLLWGAAAGWLLGAFAMPDLGEGSMLEAVIGAGVPGILIGWRLGLTRNLDLVERRRLDHRSRAAVFLTPALLFVGVALVAPTLITIWLSFKDRDSENWVWLDNYKFVFTDDKSFNVGSWHELFGSRIFWIGIALLAAGVAIGLARRRIIGEGFVAGGPSFAPLLGASVLLVFAVFSVLRGTVMNNLWWVFTVTLFSTGLGLAIAVLADRAKLESVAKSIIFMPMAISLVGASIIWRFVYLARDTSKSQTGLMNAIWVQLGRWSTGSGVPTALGTIAMWAVVVMLVLSVARLLARRDFEKLPLRGLLLAAALWIAYRFSFDGIGGFRPDDEGGFKDATIFFVQDQPFNNVWLMVILIWIQTGFAMVILSAAIKAIPNELIEAAAVDGATESQTFWRVTIPQISTTIGVVVTTLIVLVMKVYDIVKVVTNSNFETQVLANDMFEEAFLFQNTGVGAALAMLIFVSVLPVMVGNIRRMQREA